MKLAECEQAAGIPDRKICAADTGNTLVSGTGLNYYPSNPARIKVDFTNYTLRVRTGKDMVPVSQGTMKNEMILLFQSRITDYRAYTGDRRLQIRHT